MSNTIKAIITGIITVLVRVFGNKLGIEISNDVIDAISLIIAFIAGRFLPSPADTSKRIEYDHPSERAMKEIVDYPRDPATIRTVKPRAPSTD
jgi:hypothetical protein